MFTFQNVKHVYYFHKAVCTVTVSVRKLHS
jgi:hypothetical protein